MSNPLWGTGSFTVSDMAKGSRSMNGIAPASLYVYSLSAGLHPDYVQLTATVLPAALRAPSQSQACPAAQTYYAYSSLHPAD